MRDRLVFFKQDLGLAYIPAKDVEVMQLYRDKCVQIEELTINRRGEYHAYLTQICGDKNIVVVDTTTSRFSSQKFVEDVLGRSVCGFYLISLKQNRQLQYVSYWEWPHYLVDWSRINLAEYFLSSPELPICGWRGKSPVYYDDAPHSEKERASYYESISQGELEYSALIIRIFGNKVPSFDYLTVNSWMMTCLFDEDHSSFFKNIRWASDSNHLDWKPLVSLHLRDIIKRKLMDHLH